MGAGLAAAGAAWGALRVPDAHGETQRCTERYAGYRDRDRRQPFAKYMADHTRPAPAHVLRAHAGPPTPAVDIPPFERLTDDLAPTGLSKVETGYGQRRDGVTWAATRIDMPGVTADMWDWWFGWHSIDSARYKLWHPDAHRYASLAKDLTKADISDRAKYVGNTTFVDEYVGPKLQQLAINFRDPVAHGFRVPDGHTVVFGRVGSSIAPVDLGWLAHQVRPTARGVEMRSRFHLNLRGLHTPDVGQAACAVARGAAVDPRDLELGIDLGRDLMLHCGQEMNHLAGFLPRLHAEFS
ncbi:hypothetical protein GS4_06_00020 [Gordonia soli NBRC 108243]|uniref:DAPG hydrolase PhiG domain-containing protein n=1 Tax=Gordonia soli NBRC 108243 TaxID=1223545 RepID=M0QFR6_9ACTN|nr:hypothetical protein GS4_06_00020 [Gordonia soli NBRC 108243]